MSWRPEGRLSRPRQLQFAEENWQEQRRGSQKPSAVTLNTRQLSMRARRARVGMARLFLSRHWRTSRGRGSASPGRGVLVLEETPGDSEVILRKPSVQLPEVKKRLNMARFVLVLILFDHIDGFKNTSLFIFLGENLKISK